MPSRPGPEGVRFSRRADPAPILDGARQQRLGFGITAFAHQDDPEVVHRPDSFAVQIAVPTSAPLQHVAMQLLGFPPATHRPQPEREVVHRIERLVMICAERSTVKLEGLVEHPDARFEAAGSDEDVAEKVHQLKRLERKASARCEQRRPVLLGSFQQLVEDRRDADS